MYARDEIKLNRYFDNFVDYTKKRSKKTGKPCNPANPSLFVMYLSERERSVTKKEQAIVTDQICLKKNVLSDTMDRIVFIQKANREAKLRLTKKHRLIEELENSMNIHENKHLVLRNTVAYKRDRDEFYDVYRDRIAIQFHFETQRETIIRTSMYHPFCQSTDITVYIISFLFGNGAPLQYSEMIGTIAQYETSDHLDGLDSLAAFLSTCRFMHTLIGQVYFKDIKDCIEKRRDTAICHFASSSSCDKHHISDCRRLCGTCDTQYCSLRTDNHHYLYDAQDCTSCIRGRCRDCMQKYGYDTEFTQCKLCSDIYCDECDTVVNRLCIYCKDTEDNAYEYGPEEEEDDDDDYI